MLTSGDQLGPYRIKESIPGGNMGAVYRALDTRSQKEVVIKTLPNSDDRTILQGVIDNFCEEVEMMAKLKHPLILPLYRNDDKGKAILYDEGIHYMAMPYCREKDLNFWLRRSFGQLGKLPLEGVAHFVHQAAEALQYVHDNNIVHRDVKPSNFLVQSQEESARSLYPNICLADFGIARLTTTNITAVVIGTPKYMAPEQWENRPDLIDHRTDQYALGIMAYELLTRIGPFESPSQTEIRRQHCEVLAKPPSSLRDGISPYVDEVILRALKKDPQERFSSVSEFDRAFQEAAGIQKQRSSGANLGVPPTVPATPNLEVLTRNRNRRNRNLRWFGVGFIAFLIMALIFGCAQWILSQPSPKPLSQKVIKLAVDLPLSDQDGSSVEHGVQFAIGQGKSILGYTVEFNQSSALDDKHDPSIGANNVKALIGDAQVAGIIGPFDSDVAMTAIPIAASNGPIALISPSNTSNCVTTPCLGDPSGNDVSNNAKKTYFRTTALDDQQADRLADYLFNSQHYRTASIFQEDGNVYGQGFAQQFYQAWLTIGGKVVPSDSNSPISVSSPPNQANYTDNLKPLVHDHPDVVFFGGDASGAALLYGLMKQKQYNMKAFASGGAIKDEGLIEDFEGGGPVYAIAPVGDPGQEPNGVTFMTQYDQSYGNRTPYTASAYDCTNILIQAIKSALEAGGKPPIDQSDKQDAGKFRQKVIDELHSPSFSYQGVTGLYSFNGNSNVTRPSVSINELSNGSWKLQLMETLDKDNNWQRYT